MLKSVRGMFGYTIGASDGTIGNRTPVHSEDGAWVMRGAYG